MKRTVLLIDNIKNSSMRNIPFHEWFAARLMTKHYAGPLIWLVTAGLCNALQTFHRFWNHDDLFNHHVFVQQANEGIACFVASSIKAANHIQAAAKHVH